MAPFYGWGSTASRIKPLWGGSLLFTTKFQEILGTHFINLGRMKAWVNLRATHWSWKKDPWIGNPVSWPLGHYLLNLPESNFTLLDCPLPPPPLPAYILDGWPLRSDLSQLRIFESTVYMDLAAMLAAILDTKSFFRFLELLLKNKVVLIKY